MSSGDETDVCVKLKEITTGVVVDDIDEEPRDQTSETGRRRNSPKANDLKVSGNESPLKKAAMEIAREELEEEQVRAEEENASSAERKQAENEADDENDEEFDTRDPMSAPSTKSLLRFAFHGDVRRARKLLKEASEDASVDQVSVNGTDHHGWTALHWCASRGHVKFAEFLLSAGALVNKTEDINEWTPLHIAAISKTKDMCRLLLKHGARRGALDKWGDSPHECGPIPAGKHDVKSLELKKLLSTNASLQTGGL